MLCPLILWTRGHGMVRIPMYWALNRFLNSGMEDAVEFMEELKVGREELIIFEEFEDALDFFDRHKTRRRERRSKSVKIFIKNLYV
jgi:hypothetical protein